MHRIILAAVVCASLGAQSSVFKILDNPIPVAVRVEAAGDVDGDGDQDLLVADGVLVNDGHGNFAKVAIPALAFTRETAKLVDLNGDGFDDLVSLIGLSAVNGGAMRIDLNAGVFNFVGGQILTTGGPPATSIHRGFAVGDVDGDGDVDVLAGTQIVVPLSSPPMSSVPVIWSNNGAGGFALGQPTALPSVPLPSDSVLLGDLDGDGDLDAIFASRGVPPYAVQIATNSGGNFTLAPTPLATTSIKSIAFFRFNNDALPDLLVHSGQTYSTSVLAVAVNSPTGFLSPVVTPAPTFGPLIHAPIDVNGDGADEVLQFMPNYSLSLKFFTPGGSLAPAVQSWTDLTLPVAPVIADLDGDGDQDVVALGLAESVPLMNDGAGGVVRTSLRTKDVVIPYALGVGDLDADGDVDLLGHDGNYGILTAFNDGDGYFTPGPPATPAGGYFESHPFDRDGDGDTDLFGMRITLGSGPFTDVVYDNVGGTFTQIASLPSPGNSRRFQAADFDGDGDQDVLIGRFEISPNPPAPMSFFRNLGVAGFAAPVAFGPSAWTSDLDVADFDGDGALDAFQTNFPQQPSAPPSAVFLNSGSGAFNVLPQAGMFGSYTAAGDLNGDGLADLVMDGQVLFSAGGGSFVAGPALSSALLAAASLVDVDLDGDLDLVETPATVMLNAGGGVFGPPISMLPRVSISASSLSNNVDPAIADLDRDGDPDLAARGAYSNGASTTAPGPIVFLNTTRQIAHGSIARPGRPASIDLYGTPGGAWFLWTSNGTTSLPLPPWGTVLIDPASAQLGAMGVFAGPTPPLPGTATLSVLVPNNPALIGWTTWWQSIDAAQMRLTNRIQITVMNY